MCTLNGKVERMPSRPFTMQSVHSGLRWLHELRSSSGPSITSGLTDEEIERFLERDPKLEQAITQSIEYRTMLIDEYGPELFQQSEVELCENLQKMGNGEDDQKGRGLNKKGRSWISFVHCENFVC